MKEHYQKAEDRGQKVSASPVADDSVLIIRLSGKQIQVFAPSAKDTNAFYSPISCMMLQV
ncbi:hypothetical protein E4V51_25455 [Paenibacillus sp. 28ISP30-2]|nr:hypothetical protein [Paenibacillus sp. 28ISP30-2]